MGVLLFAAQSRTTTKLLAGIMLTLVHIPSSFEISIFLFVK